MLVSALPAQSFEAPDSVERLFTGLPASDRSQARTAVSQLHVVNGALWEEEDAIRDCDNPAEIAAGKRRIDALNRDRNKLIDQIDEVLARIPFHALSTGRVAIHTETLGSVLDRLSILFLRIWHTEALAEHGSVVAVRVPALHAQRAQLETAITDLTNDLLAGVRRLPDGRRFKLYGIRREQSA